MRNWVWTSPSSESFLKPGVRSGTPGFAVPAMHPPQCARGIAPAAACSQQCAYRKVPAVMCPRILPGGGARIGWVGWLRGTLYRV